MDIIKTGIEDLDILLRGGFILPPKKYSNNKRNKGNPQKGLVVLIRGKAGTGKSTLALQIASNIALCRLKESSSKKDNCDWDKVKTKLTTNCSPQGHYLSLEQEPHELEQKLSEMYAALAIRNLRKLKRLLPSETCKIHHQIDWGKLEEKPLLFFRSVYEFSLLSHEELAKEATDENLNLITEKKNMAKMSQQEAEEKKAAEIKTVAEMVKELKLPLHFVCRRIKNPEASFLQSTNPLTRALDFLEILQDKQDKNSDKGQKNDNLLPVLVMDGLNVLNTSEREAINIRQLIHGLRDHAEISIIGYEPLPSMDDFLDYQADVVIDLEGKQLKEPMEYFLREMTIRKARYQDTAQGRHQYKIRSWGFEIYPSIHFQVHTPNNMNNQLLDSLKPFGGKNTILQSENSTSGSFLDRILNIQPGSSTVLLGARGTFKTTLSIDFLVGAARKGKKNGLLISGSPPKTVVR